MVISIHFIAFDGLTNASLRKRFGVKDSLTMSISSIRIRINSATLMEA